MTTQASPAPAAEPASDWVPERPPLRPLRLLVAWLIAAPSLLFAAWIVPGVRIPDFWSAIGVAAVIAVFNAVLPPLIAAARLPFTILADSAKQVSKDYGVLHRPLGLMELARRETFIIDPEGHIAKHYRDVDPEKHSKQVLADLKALQEDFRKRNGRTGGAVPVSPHRALPA